MSLYEEKLLLKKLKESISAGLMTPCPKLSRFYRKLCVRQVGSQIYALLYTLSKQVQTFLFLDQFRSVLVGRWCWLGRDV